MVTKRPYWEEKPDSVEAKVLHCAGFDDVAPIAVYFLADLKYEKQALEALDRLKKSCKHIPEIANLTPSLVKEGNTPGVDMGHIYNRLYEMIAEGYGSIAVDGYGAWGHIDAQDRGHYGDDSGYFPWYMDEETLQKDLKEWNEME